jgi:hypothetical protein
MLFMKGLNCYYFKLVIILQSIKSLEFCEISVNCFNMLETAFEVNAKFGRSYRKIVNIAA